MPEYRLTIAWHDKPWGELTFLDVTDEGAIERARLVKALLPTQFDYILIKALTTHNMVIAF
jgi:hypothetical protein